MEGLGTDVDHWRLAREIAYRSVDKAEKHMMKYDRISSLVKRISRATRYE